MNLDTTHFDTLPAMEVSNIETTQDTSSNDEKDVEENLIKLPLNNNMLSEPTIKRYVLC